MRPAHLGRIFGMIELLPVMGERQDAGRMDVDVNVDDERGTYGSMTDIVGRRLRARGDGL
ncbi:hypothetical protein GCM10027203_76370 [Nonomuraea fastidiosa]